MATPALRSMLVSGILIASSAGWKQVSAAELFCPAGYEGVSAEAHHNDAYASSAPEIKIRTATTKDYALFHKATHSLIAKAVEQARAKRSNAIADGIENACAAKQQYISQIIPFADRASGCDYRLVTRPADEEHVWVQAVAFCKYDWNCCRSLEAPTARGGAPLTPSGTAAFTLDGPLGHSSSTAPTTPSKSKH